MAQISQMVDAACRRNRARWSGGLGILLDLGTGSGFFHSRVMEEEGDPLTGGDAIVMRAAAQFVLKVDGSDEPGLAEEGNYLCLAITGNGERANEFHGSLYRVEHLFGACYVPLSGCMNSSQMHFEGPRKPLDGLRERSKLGQCLVRLA
jgi:hypothetical protein